MAQIMTGEDRTIGLATYELLQGDAWIRLKSPSKASPLINSALQRTETIRTAPALRGNLLISKGWLESASGNSALALADYQEAHHIFLKIHDDRSQARILIAIAILYDEAYNHETALKYYHEALNIYIGDTAFSYSIYDNIGQNLKEEKKYTEAKVQTKRALFLAQKIGNSALIAHSLSNLARIELFINQTGAADQYIKWALRLVDPKSDEYGDLLATAAQAALQHSRISQAVSLVGHSFANVDIDHTPVGMRERHETAYDVYSAAGDSAHALIHLAAMKRLDDEATRLATSTNTALMGARFDFANQELRIAKLKADETARTLTYERARSRTQSWIFIGVISVVAVVVALLILGLRKLRRSSGEVSRANVVLEKTNTALGQALAARTDFLATTSHEIRTPLNGILGMTQVMLADADVDEGVRERVGIVHAAGITMRALVDDILDVAKMEKGHLAVDNAPFDLRATLGELVKLWREQARAKGIAFEADLSDCPAHVEGDVARLRQVVFNLLGNAIKFTEAGGVSLRAWRVPGEHPRYRVAVTDSGIGIAVDKHEVIFESFRQGDTSTTRRFGGTGLGLAISRRLARAMGGDVTVSSEPGSGSVFLLDLPLVDASPVIPETVERVATLLVIERNPIARGMFKALLTPRFGDIAFAGSVAEAVALMEAGGVAWVLADDATLQAEGPLDRQVAVIAAVAKPLHAPFALLRLAADGEDGQQFIGLGVQQILGKPIARTTLVQQLFSNMDQPVNRLECRAA